MASSIAFSITCILFSLIVNQEWLTINSLFIGTLKDGEYILLTDLIGMIIIPFVL